MRLGTALLVTLLSLVGAPTHAQTVSPELQEAYYAWDRGEYAAALEGYLAALNGRAGDRLKDGIALLTGELYEVTELTDAGSDIRVSPDGRHGTYAVGRGTEPSIALFELGETPRVISTFEGRSPTMSSIGTVAFLRVERTSDMAAAQQALLDASARSDRAAFFEAQAEIRWIEALNTSLWIRDIQTGTEREVFLGDIVPVGMTYSSDGRTLFLAAGRLGENRTNDIYAVRAFRLEPETTLTGRGFKASPQVIPGGRYLLYRRPSENPLPQAPGTERFSDDEGGSFALVDLQEEEVYGFAGTGPVYSASGTVLAFMTQGSDSWTIEAASVEPMSVAPRHAHAVHHARAAILESHCEPGSVTGREPRRVPEAGPRELGYLRVAHRWLHGGAAGLQRDPTRPLSPVLERESHPGGQGRRPAPAFLHLRPSKRVGDQALPQQHGAYDRPRVRVGAGRRRQQGCDRVGEGRRYGIAGAGSLCGGPRPYGHQGGRAREARAESGGRAKAHGRR